MHRVTATTTLGEKHVAAVGCCNDQAAAHGTYTGEGVSDTGASGLPFTQVVLCRLEATNTSYVVPFGTVGYFDSTVPRCVRCIARHSDTVAACVGVARL